MPHLLLNLHLLVYYGLLCLASLSQASSTHLPRMTFTDREMPFKRMHLPEHRMPIWILQGDRVMAAGQRNLYSVDFQNLQETPSEWHVFRKECVEGEATSEACHHNINVLHERKEANQLFLCGTKSEETACCNMNISQLPSLCSPSEHETSIQTSIKEFMIEEGEPSVLIGDSELYITQSEAQSSVGIHKFGKNRVRPAHRGKEQQYVGLVPSRRREDPLQDKVYAFYKEKNRDVGLGSDMWLPFVAQVCMADKGGPKNNMQFAWTSQLNARLFCGDHSTRQHYSELVDVATLHADHWQDTRVYALFRNEWGRSAVCVYTIQAIEEIFTHSKFKGYQKVIPNPRPGTCVADSTKLSPEVLSVVDQNSEMEDRVMPLNNSGPVLVGHHHYTHICIDNFQNRNYHHTVMFLSTENGRVHKVMENKTEAFFIAEYRPFSHTAHISKMILHHSTRKLYVSSNSEVVQLDVGSCAQYGDRCEECILARDPYCGWNGTHCTPDTNKTLQDVEKGNHAVCVSMPKKVSRSPSISGGEAAESISLPLRSKYFLRCPVSSLHADYTWRHGENSTACSPTEQCLVLIDSMGPEQEGTYRCVLEEMGYTRTLAQYQLYLDSRAAGWASIPLAWVPLMAVVLMSLFC